MSNFEPLPIITNHSPFDTLFIIGRGPDLFENITIYFKLAQVEASKRGKKVEIILMHDAAWWAQKDGKGKELIAAAPDDDMSVEERMKKLVETEGVIVNVCKPCMVFRGIKVEELHEGIKVIEGYDSMEKKDAANRVLCFM